MLLHPGHFWACWGTSGIQTPEGQKRLIDTPEAPGLTKRASPNLQARRGGLCYEGSLKARLGEGVSVDSA